jgi:acetyl esterase/lipase
MFKLLNKILNHGQFNIIKDLPYTDTNMSSQQLDLYLPKKSSTKLSLIIYIHGGGWKQGNKSGGFLSLLPFLQTGRFIGASINYRFSHEAIWPAQIEDCRNAVRWLRANASKYNIDPDRIAIYGASAGAQLASLLGLDAEMKISGVVDFCGPVDMYELSLINKSAPDSLESHLIGKPILENPELAKAISPIYQITKDCPPFLIAHGDKDPLIPISIAEKFYNAIITTGVKTPPIFIKKAGFGHGRLIFAPGKILTKQVLEFFEQHLY